MRRVDDSSTLDPDDTFVDWTELGESGLLWLINKVCFHPRGFALAIVTDSKTGKIKGWDLLGNGSEPWRFTEEVDNEYFHRAEGTLHRFKFNNDYERNR